MPTIFWPAPEVKGVAEPLIERYHPHLLKYAVRIEYWFRSDVSKNLGHLVMAQTRRVSNLSAALVDGARLRADREPDSGEEEPEYGQPFFVIVVASPIWEGLTPAQMDALTDHELMHIQAEKKEDGAVKLSLRHHDLEEFNAIVERHGLWQQDVLEFAKTIAPYVPQIAFEWDAPPGQEPETRNGNGHRPQVPDEYAVTVSYGEEEATVSGDPLHAMADRAADAVSAKAKGMK